jgi:hypothetical protein
MRSTIKDQISDYILKNHQAADPIIQKDLYRIFVNVSPITIRQTLLRLSKNGIITKSESIKGVYFISKQNTVLKSHSLNFNQLIENKFLVDMNKKVIGYESGLSLANELGLTTQTSSTVYVVSNAVADRKRELLIDNRRIIIDKSRIDVDHRNYRFLQVLDLISDFESFCEVDPEQALTVLKTYLRDLTLSKKEIDTIFRFYPIKTERNYYKLGVDHVIAQES